MNKIFPFEINNWANPYPKEDLIDSIETGLPETRFKYSPRFLDAEADVFIPLTGRRSEDYKIAERSAGIAHIGGKTVWHHVWNEDGKGNYEMQLVDYKAHIKTYPHAGGCKLWCKNNNVGVYKKVYGLYVDEGLYGSSIDSHKVRKTGMISAGNVHYDGYYILDYILGKRQKILDIKNAYVTKRHKKLRPWGLDPYGNMFYKDGKSLYVYDHEFDLLILLSGKINDIMW